MTDNLAKARAALREKRANGPIPQSNPLKNGLHSTSLRDSINAHCYMCMGGEIDNKSTHGIVKRLIQECESEVCPLNNVRPYQK